MGLANLAGKGPRPKTKYLKTENLSSEIQYAVPPKEPKNAPENDSSHHRHAVYASETTGLLIIAVVLLVLTLVRYWHNIHWSLR